MEVVEGWLVLWGVVVVAEEDTPEICSVELSASPEEQPTTDMHGLPQSTTCLTSGSL